jgi:hypothetical protein
LTRGLMEDFILEKNMFTDVRGQSGSQRRSIAPNCALIALQFSVRRSTASE